MATTQTNPTQSTASETKAGAERKQRSWILRLGRRILRKLEAFQGRHSTVGDAPVLDNGSFPWTSALESAHPAIRAELDRVLEHPEEIPAFNQISPDQSRIARGTHWKTFAFYVFGQRVDDNCALCPRTAEVLDALPKLQNAWFSILAPRYHIPPHRGPTRAIIRAHLPLILPRDARNCWIRVDKEIHHWEIGKCFIFDDTYEHEVRNDTEDIRVVLFLDFDRPMDRVGEWVNRILVSLIRRSPYVSDPMRNLADWNRRRKASNKPHA